jgi:hypothetical protein
VVALLGVLLLSTTLGFGVNRPIAFTDVNVVPMTTEVVLSHQTVLVSGQRIAQVGPEQLIKVPNDAICISGSGLYLVPGLVDSHVHLEPALGARPEFADGPLFLNAGVTTVFNLRGGPEHLRWRQRIQSGELLAPNLYSSGEFIDEPRVNSSAQVEREVLRQAQDGYDLLKIHEIVDADFKVTTTSGLSRPAYNRLLDTARQAHMPIVGHIPIELGLRAALAEHQNLAHVVMFIFGYFIPMQTRAFRSWTLVCLIALVLLVLGCMVLIPVVVVAKLRNRTLLGGEFRNPARLALSVTFLAFLCAAWYASMEWLARDFLIYTISACAVVLAYLAFLMIRATTQMWTKRNQPRYALWYFSVLSFAAALFVAAAFYFVPLSWRSTNSSLARIAKCSANAKIMVMTTLVVNHAHEMAHDPELRVLSETARKNWGVDDDSITDERWLQHLLGPHIQWFQERIAGELYRAGVPLLLGTDTFGFPGIVPGNSVHKELELLNESGLTPYQALQTATVNPATFLNRPNEFGQIAPGQRADMLLVSGNPLEDLAALRNLHGVMIRGRWLGASELHKITSDREWLTR